MRYANLALNTVFDLLLSPFRGENPWPGMIVVSFVTAALFVWLFRSCSDQQALKRSKGRMLARALELLLYRHDMVVSLTAFPRIVVANGRYLITLLRPFVLALVPSILLLIQLAGWYEYRPFAFGEPVLLTVDFADQSPVMSEEVELRPSDGLKVETESLRIPSLNEISWRLRAQSASSTSVVVGVGGLSLAKEIAIGSGMRRISDRRVRAGFWNELVHPGEPPLPRDGPVESIRVRYPRRQLFLGGTEVHWLLAFLVLTMLFGLLFGRLLKVSF